MPTTMEVPIWIVVALAVLAAVALADRLVLPSARWFVRRRLDRVVDELNARLKLGLAPFKLTKREVLIDRLIYDQLVAEAVEAEAQAQGVPRAVVMARVTRYAREIVPSFNAYVYFRVGYALARRLARALYRVRLGYADMAALESLGTDVTVVFVMNHRSNMDYLLVAYIAAEQTALSYAVGEWARIWPLQTLIRAMGAYFIRRNSGDPLYRRVLERYVYMATQAGVTQAIYPEGGLSRDGALRGPKLGLMDYLMRAYDPGGRDIVFIPVGINYDRVLEDRTLLRETDAVARPARFAALRGTFGFIADQIGLMLRGEWRRFGYACVNFGTPLSLRQWLADAGEPDPRRLAKVARMPRVEALARDLMAAVGRVIPVLPVSLVASIFVRAPDRQWSELELKAEAERMMRAFEAAGAHVYIPRSDRDYAITVGLRMLTLRHFVAIRDGLYAAAPNELPILRYYANAIVQSLPPEAAGGSLPPEAAGGSLPPEAAGASLPPTAAGGAQP
jgi:glycerol-3-phosphate O-acyltransferase